MRILVAIAPLIFFTQVAHAKDVPLPPEVATRQGDYGKKYIDTFTLPASGAGFSKVKLCLAQNISNPPITITGGTNAPFAFYSNNKTQTSTIQGGGIFKYEDAESGAVIVTGSTEGGPSAMGLSREIVRFELTATSGPQGTSLKFSNIERATLNTGTVTNEGFYPVGVWRGAKPLNVVDTLRTLGAKIESCLR